MQSSSSHQPFKLDLAGASPATDAICSQGVISSARRSAKAEVRGASPRESTSLWPLSLSSYRSGFVNRYSSVRVRPGDPFHGDHDVTAASRPVTAFVPVQIRLVTPISI